ncbi:MAG: RNA methyltransferase [Eubacterium sp.]|nr:RNA methyltransferase [Eubacterium sp.]
MITSSSNEKIKQIIQLNTKARARRDTGCFVAEGYKLFCETPVSLRRAVYVTESFAGEHPDIAAQASVQTVSDPVFRKMCDTRTPQGILTVAAMPQWEQRDLLGDGKRSVPLVLVLENLQDPGNVGTIIRTAEGAGVTGIVIGSETADIFGPKVIRATMGSVFRMPVIRTADLGGMLDFLKENGVNSYASHLSGSVPYTEPDYTKGTALLIGNEGKGLSRELTGQADYRIRIPMEGSVESLNAAVAASVMMYEVHRQRTAV